MAKRVMDKVLNFMGFEEVEEEDGRTLDEVPEQPLVKSKKGAVLTLHPGSQKQQMRVVVCDIRTFDEVQNVADHLKGRRPVILNLEQSVPEEAKRIVDFISGATYALNGSMQKVGQGIFLCVPSNIDIASELKEKSILSWVKS